MYACRVGIYSYIWLNLKGSTLLAWVNDMLCSFILSIYFWSRYIDMSCIDTIWLDYRLADREWTGRARCLWLWGGHPDQDWARTANNIGLPPDLAANRSPPHPVHTHAINLFTRDVGPLQLGFWFYLVKYVGSPPIELEGAKQMEVNTRSQNHILASVWNFRDIKQWTYIEFTQSQRNCWIKSRTPNALDKISFDWSTKKNIDRNLTFSSHVINYKSLSSCNNFNSVIPC